MNGISQYAVVFTLLVCIFSNAQGDDGFTTRGLGAVEDVVTQLQFTGTAAHVFEQNERLTTALKEAIRKIPEGETRNLEIVTKGNDFYAVREKTNSPDLEPGLNVGPTFTVASQNTNLAQRLMGAQQAKQLAADRELAIANAVESEKKAAQAKEDAKRAKEANDAAQKAANDAKALLDKRNKEAAKAEREAQRNGERVQERIRAENNRYKKEGGPYRSPAGSSSH
ncbi:hypothetical protein [Pseudomonas silensiensis]|uniref:hypothetical protein n=1 Tax=Pseudomonas silensiensis TaxID=2991049 RepID=UPI003D20B360